MASLEEKSNQFTRMAGQPDLFDSVDLAQISEISRNPGYMDFIWFWRLFLDFAYGIALLHFCRREAQGT